MRYLGTYPVNRVENVTASPHRTRCHFTYDKVWLWLVELKDVVVAVKLQFISLERYGRIHGARNGAFLRGKVAESASVAARDGAL